MSHSLSDRYAETATSPEKASVLSYSCRGLGGALNQETKSQPEQQPHPPFLLRHRDWTARQPCINPSCLVAPDIGLEPVLLPSHFARILVFSDSKKDRLAETVIPRPFREFYLANHRRFDPMATRLDRATRPLHRQSQNTIEHRNEG